MSRHTPQLKPTDTTATRGVVTFFIKQSCHPIRDDIPNITPLIDNKPFLQNLQRKFCILFPSCAQ